MAERSMCQRLDDSILSNGFLQSFDTVLTDCDGVLWIGNNVLPGAIETLKYLRSQGKNIIYVTNNSTKSRKQYLKKFESLGFDANLDEIYSSAYCAALYLKSLNFKQKVYAIAMDGVAEELRDMGINSLPLGPDIIPDDWIPWIRQGVPLDSEVGAVVVGYDVHFSYPKMIRGASYLRDPDCIFIATNTDEQFPSEGNVTLPGTGAIVAAVSCAANRQPRVMGKPSKYMFECIKMEHPDLKPERCLMIGDRLSTDIVFGQNLSMQTLFVLTGVNSLEDAQSSLESSTPNKALEVPHFYSPSLKDVAELFDNKGI